MVTEEIRQPGQREPLMALRALAIQQLPLTLAVPYKGMLLEQTLQPRVVGADGITFPPPKLMLCAAIYQIVYLHSRFLPATVRGYVQWLTTERCELHLSNLRFLATSWRPRSEQRVQPEEHLMVTVWVNRMPFQALLADLSVHGVGLLFDSWVETPPANLERGLRFEVTLPLARQYAITVTAELVHVRRYQEHLWQVGARLAPTLEQERWLEHHVSERRVKIYAELEQRARELREAAQGLGLFLS